jgi:tetratricopeptide (TPR) repeat protein
MGRSFLIHWAAFMFIPSGCVFGQPVGNASPVIDSLEAALLKSDDTVRVILLNKLSFEYYKQSAYEQAAHYGTQAVELSRELLYDRGIAKGLNNLGNVFFDQGDPPKASKNFLQALEIAEAINDILVISHVTNNLGELHREIGDYERALQYYLMSLRSAEQMNDDQGRAETINNIGLVHMSLGNYEKARECFQTSISFFQKINDLYSLSTIHSNMADTYLHGGEIGTARRMLEQSLIIKQQIQDRQGEIICLLTIGNTWLQQNSPDSAKLFFDEALNLSDSIENLALKAGCYLGLGRVYAHLGNLPEAINCQNQYLKLAMQTGSRAEARTAYFILSELYERKHDYEKAFGYLMKFKELNDSIFSSESIRRMADMQARYDFEWQSRELDNLRRETIMQSNINNNQRIIIAGGVVLTALLVIFFYTRYVSSRQKAALLNDRVAAQNRELATVALLVGKKNQAFQVLKMELEHISKARENPYDQISRLIRQLDSEIDFDKEWETFKYHFEQVHPEFFNRLKLLAPTLTGTELRFCAYLKINLSTKEIARLTNSTVRGVQQMRYRINLKLPQHNHSTLNDYLVKL